MWHLQQVEMDFKLLMTTHVVTNGMKKAFGIINTAISIGLILFSGCIKSEKHPEEAMYRANLQRTGAYNTKGVHQLSELRWKCQTEGRQMYSSPVVAEGVVCFGDNDGNLYAVDINTGQQKWMFKTGDRMMYVSPAIADGVVYFVCDDGNLYAVR